MNEDARDEDSVTGRALGTLALIGASAFGVGFGVRSVMKAGNAATNGAKKAVETIKQSKANNALKKEFNRVKDVVDGGDLSKLKSGDIYHESGGNRVLLKESAEKGIFLPAQEDELIEVGTPIKKSVGRRNREMRDQMREKPQQKPAKEIIKEQTKAPSGNKQQQSTSTNYNTYGGRLRNPLNVSNEDYTDLSNV